MEQENNVQEQIKEVKPKWYKNQKVIGFIVAAIMIIAGVIVNEQIKVKRNIDTIHTNAKKSVRQADTRYSIITSDLETLKGDILKMESEKVSSNDKTDIVEKIDILIDNINNRDNNLSNFMTAVSDALLKTELSFTEEQTTLYTERFIYMIESIQYLERITDSETTLLRNSYAEVIEKAGINGIYEEFGNKIGEELANIFQ